jgi:hypothetical protein
MLSLMRCLKEPANRKRIIELKTKWQRGWQRKEKNRRRKKEGGGRKVKRGENKRKKEAAGACLPDEV